jgi:hypothetical protein
MYISWFVSLASSSAAISIWICLEVLLSALNPSWLSCSIWYLSPYADRIEVNVLVYNLYIVLASAIGLWFVSCDGLPFLYSKTVRLVFHDAGICFCL